MEERLLAFERYLRRYSARLGLKVDVELAKKVERVQLKIMDDVRAALDRALSKDVKLVNVLAALYDSGKLKEYVLEVSRELGGEAPDINVGEALAAAVSGNLEVRGSKEALMAVQAVARALAESYEEAYGNVEEPSPYCPLCDSESDLMIKQGVEYRMVCPLCGYEWVVSRGYMKCPYCGNSNPFKLGVLSDRERLVGLAVCQECGSTWKIVVDEEIATAPRTLLPLFAMASERLRSVAESLAGLAKGGGVGNDSSQEGRQRQLREAQDEAPSK